MKKLFATLLVAGALAMTSCGASSYSAAGADANLKSRGYSSEILSYVQAKSRISGLNYDIVPFESAVFATKGSGDDKDLLLAFFFSSVDAADLFMNSNNYQNMGAMNSYGERELGGNLTKKVGIANNVAYVGSTTSYSVAFQ